MRGVLVGVRLACHCALAGGILNIDMLLFAIMMPTSLVEMKCYTLLCTWQELRGGHL